MLKRVTEPAELPLTLDEVKTHLRLDGNQEDSYLTALIQAAAEHVQNTTNRILVRAEYEYTGKQLGSSLVLPAAPLGNIISVTAMDAEAVETTFAATTDYTYSESGFTTLTGVSGSAWFATTYPTVRVRFTAGYETAAKIPQPIKWAMLLIIGSMYENREDTNDRFPKASEALLSSYRIYSF